MPLVPWPWTHAQTVFITESDSLVLGMNWVWVYLDRHPNNKGCHEQWCYGTFLGSGAFLALGFLWETTLLMNPQLAYANPYGFHLLNVEKWLELPHPIRDREKAVCLQELGNLTRNVWFSSPLLVRPKRQLFVPPWWKYVVCLFLSMRARLFCITLWFKAITTIFSLLIHHLFLGIWREFRIGGFDS